MINIEETINHLALILSLAHKYKYREEAIEKRIAYSNYFIAIEKGYECSALYIRDQDLINTIFYDVNINQEDFVIYNQSRWLSELYLRIQSRTKMTFEAIFYYLPIKKGYEMFPLYHEMDFAQAEEYFISLVKQYSVLYLAMQNGKISVEKLSKESGLSYSTVSSLRRRKKNINKVAAINILKMAEYLHMRPESLMEQE